MEETTKKTREQLESEGYRLVSSKSYKIHREDCNHNWNYGQVILGQPFSARECKNCGKREN